MPAKKSTRRRPHREPPRLTTMPNDLKPGLEIIFEFLAGEGYRPEIDFSGDIEFKADGLTFLFALAKGDPYYARLTLPAIYTIEPELQYAIAKGIDKLNRELKLIKAYTYDGAVWLCVDMLHPIIDNWMYYLSRLIEVMSRATRLLEDFIHEMKRG